MSKKILVLTMSQSQSKYEVTRLEEEALKEGIEVKKALYKDMKFGFERGGEVFIKGEEVTFENTLAVWFRVAGTVSGKYVEGRNVLIRILESKGIFCSNHSGYLGWARMGKIAQHGVFIINSIPVVPTRIFYTKDEVRQEIMATGEVAHFGWPLIVKHDRGFQGKSVRKFDTAKMALEWVNKMDEVNLGMFLWQKWLPTKWDLRVIVLGGKAIGAMKRSAVGKEFRSNFSLGGMVEKWRLSEEDARLAEKVAHVCGLDYAGVDIMKNPKNPSKSPLDKGDFQEEDYESFVLEVNRQCQYQGFEKATEINVAKLVVDMLIHKR